MSGICGPASPLHHLCLGRLSAQRLHPVSPPPQPPTRHRRRFLPPALQERAAHPRTQLLHLLQARGHCRAGGLPIGPAGTLQLLAPGFVWDRAAGCGSGGKRRRRNPGVALTPRMRCSTAPFPSCARCVNVDAIANVQLQQTREAPHQHGGGQPPHKNFLLQLLCTFASFGAGNGVSW